MMRLFDIRKKLCFINDEKPSMMIYNQSSIQFYLSINAYSSMYLPSLYFWSSDSADI